MVLASGGIPTDSRQMGATGYRSVCQRSKCQSTLVLFTESSGSAGGTGYAAGGVGFQVGLCISAFTSDPTGTDKAGRHTDKCYPNSAALAKESVVLAPAGPLEPTTLEVTGESGPTITGTSTAPQPSHAQPDSVVSERELLRREGLSERVIETLLQSRKEVTSKIYQKV